MPLILPYNGVFPKIHPSVYIADNATIIGDVTIGQNSSIWFNSIIRGDVQKIEIGNNTNIQDGTIIHVTRVTGPTIIGDNVTIGHKALLHACTAESDSFIGMGSIMLDFSIISSNSMLAAGAVLTPKKQIAQGQIWAGNPAKFFRNMRQEEIQHIQTSADNYVKLGQEYKNA